MSEQKHTPTPWRIVQGTIIKQDYRHIGLGDDSGVQIGSACGYAGSGFFPSDEEGVANAAFIVKAVNSHDALVAALRKIAGAHDGEDGCYYTNRTNINIARAALAAAEAP